MLISINIAKVLRIYQTTSFIFSSEIYMTESQTLKSAKKKKIKKIQLSVNTAYLLDIMIIPVEKIKMIFMVNISSVGREQA